MCTSSSAVPVTRAWAISPMNTSLSRPMVGYGDVMCVMHGSVGRGGGSHGFGVSKLEPSTRWKPGCWSVHLWMMRIVRRGCQLQLSQLRSSWHVATWMITRRAGLGATGSLRCEDVGAQSDVGPAAMKSSPVDGMHAGVQNCPGAWAVCTPFTAAGRCAGRAGMLGIRLVISALSARHVDVISALSACQAAALKLDRNQGAILSACWHV